MSTAAAATSGKVRIRPNVTDENAHGVRPRSRSLSGQAGQGANSLAERVFNRLAESEIAGDRAQQACGSPRQGARGEVEPTLQQVSDAYAAEAKDFIEVRHDHERIATYVEARLIGASSKDARKVCKYGMLFLQMSAEKRSEMQMLLDRHGVSRSPLCWPRGRFQLDQKLEDCPLLGEGNFNKTYALRINGADYAFKPFVEVAKRRKEQVPFSGVGQLLGLQEEKFHPDLRSLMAVRVADALGLLGPDGVVVDMQVSIVNGVPGMLSRRIHGGIEGKGNLWAQSVPFATNVGQQLQTTFSAKCKNLEDVKKEVLKLGLLDVAADAKGFRLTGTLGKRNLHASLRYTSRSYNLAVMNIQVYARLINLGDLHSGNVMHEYGGAKDWGARLFDLDEAFAPANPETVSFSNAHQVTAITAASPPPPLIPLALRTALASTRCREMLAVLRREAGGHLPESDIKNFEANEKALRASTLPDCSALQVYTRGTELQPHAILLHKWIGYSTNSDWDSDDSDNEELVLPEATEY